MLYKLLFYCKKRTRTSLPWIRIIFRQINSECRFSGKTNRVPTHESLFFSSCQCVKMNLNLLVFNWWAFKFGFIYTHYILHEKKRQQTFKSTVMRKWYSLNELGLLNSVLILKIRPSIFKEIFRWFLANFLNFVKNQNILGVSFLTFLAHFSMS